jgi:hypothetical protein
VRLVHNGSQQPRARHSEPHMRQSKAPHVQRQHKL